MQKVVKLKEMSRKMNSEAENKVIDYQKIIDGLIADNLSTNEKILKGNLCVKGTRLPVDTLFDYLQSDHIVDDCVDSYPSLTKNQMRSLLNLAKYSIRKSYENFI